MIINSLPTPVPTLNSDVIRPQKSPDSSPESTVIQNRKVAPIPDARVVQQGSEASNGNGIQDHKQDVTSERVAQDRGDDPGGKGPEGASANRSELLSDDELREVENLAQRDREVRAHEQAHLSAAGDRATSGASFSYTTGPDGKRYATGGEVGIDTSPVRGDPEATLRAAALIQRAALAPAEPSAQDRQIAAAASAMAHEAQTEVSQQRAEESQTKSQAEPKSASQAASQSTSGDATPPKADVDTAGNAVSDSRDEQTKSRQQQLEDVFSAVERGLDGDPRGGNLDNFLPAGQVGNTVLRSTERPAQERRIAIEEDSIAQNVRLEAGPQRDDEVRATPVEPTQASVSIDESVVSSDEQSGEVVVDARDEQIKSQQQQLEGMFSDVAQGLGGEPRGTNLDYFL